MYFLYVDYYEKKSFFMVSLALRGKLPFQSYSLLNYFCDKQLSTCYSIMTNHVGPLKPVLKLQMDQSWPHVPY